MPLDQNDRRRLVEEFIISMPSLPTTVGRVVDLCNSGDVSPNKLYKAISLDPVLTGQVLQLINTTYYSLASQITSLIRAMTMLGLNTVKNLALSAAIMNTVPEVQKFRLLPTSNFWSHSIRVGVTAKLLARNNDVPLMEQEEYFIGGLLHDIGKIPFGQEYGAVLEHAGQQRIPIIAAEREMLGVDHQQVGLMIAEKWKLNRAISSCIGYHHSVEEADKDNLRQVTFVAVGNAYSNIYDIDGGGNIFSSEDGLEDLLEIAGLDWLEFSTIREDIETEVKKAQVFLQI